MIRKLLLTCGFLLGLPFVSNAQQAVIYTTTADGTKKLEKMVGQTSPSTSSSNVITLLPEKTNQSIDGFGYAITYSSCYNLLKMPKALRHSLLKKTFSARGYGASYVRISIGCNDFSSTEYSLCDTKGEPGHLVDAFALQSDELNYVLPVLKEIMAINPTVKVIATPWTCPKWMKVDNITDKNPYDSWTNGHLNPDYYGAYAAYFVKFIEAMKAQGVTIYAVSPQNEPLNQGNCASLYMPWSEEADFVKRLAQKFHEKGVTTKIYIYDHNYNYDNISDQDNYPLKVYEKLDGEVFDGSELIVGAAYHNYGGDNGVLSYIHGQRPDKELIFSETSIGEWNHGRDLKQRLVADMKDVVLGTLNKSCKAVLVWNFMLDTNKGPNLDGGCTTCYGAVDIDPNGYTQWSYNSHYYIISHISSVVKPGAYRIDTNGWWATDMDYSAYKNPDGSLAIIFASSNAADQNFTVYDGKQYVDVTVPANSVVSVLFGDLKKATPDVTENGTYDFMQNKSYHFSDEEVGAVDPDFFFKNLDESGTYRFLGVDGKYTIVMDHGMLTAKAADAAVYVSGSPKTFYKAGLYESTAWQMPVNLAQVAPGVYRMTVKAGESVNPTELNFKFFSTENWGEFNIETLTGLAADKLVVSDGTDGFDKGNIHYKEGETLDEGSTYVFTIKTADNSLDLQKLYDITDKVTLDAAIADKAEYFKFVGTITEEMLYTLMNYKDEGGVIRYMDFSEASVESLPRSFMSMGNVNVVEGEEDVQKDQVNEYLEKVLLPNGLKKIGDYAFSSCNNLRVINLTRDIQTLGKAMLMYDYRLHALSFDNRQTAATVTIPMNFMQMYNNKDPYKEEYVASSQEGLKELYIGDNWNVDSIGRLAFFQNQNLVSFKYSDQGTTIGNIRTNAFTDAHSLPADDINNIIKNSTEIWNAAFYSCRQLDRLTLPVSLKMVDNAAFGDCPITDIYVNSSISPAAPLYEECWYPYSWNYFSEYAFAGIRNKTNGTDKHVRLNQMTLHFGEGVYAKEYRYKTTQATDDTRVNENGETDEATGKAKYGEFLRLLTKSIYQDDDYDIKGQEHADLRIYRTFKSNWNTICLPVTLTDGQVKKTFGDNTVVAEFVGVQKAAAEEANILRFKTTHEGIVAGKPYIIMLKDDYGNNVALNAPYTEETYNKTYYDEYVSDKTQGYYLIEDVTLPSADHLPELQKVTYDKYTFVGNYAAMNISADNKVLYISNNLFKYKNAGETTNSTGYRAYFIVAPGGNGSGLAKSNNISIDGVLTNISTADSNSNHDFLPIYDLMGRKVDVPKGRLSAGIYIIGGKKFVVK